MRLAPELAPVFVRVHTRVKRKRSRGEREWTHPTVWANFALVFDCETTTDLREDLNFLWWRFCELKDGAYVCQREGVVYGDNVDAKSVTVIHEFARGKRADVEDGCPEDILVQSRTQFCGRRILAGSSCSRGNREFQRAVRLESASAGVP